MNILVLTSVYKDESLGTNDRSTNIVNSFVYDWVQQGHNVKVIHNSHRYPIFVHRLPFSIKTRLAAKMGFYIADYSVICKKHYEDHGAEVWRLPMLKLIPHKAHGKREIISQVNKINSILKEREFEPDVIIGHWASPQMELVSELKKTHDCKTAIVLHGMGYITQKDFPVKEYLKRIDKLGCRSKTQAEITKEALGLKNMPFVCYSGVPDEYLNKFSLDVEKFEDIKTWKFAYVGRLVGYKRVDIVIQALSCLSIDWELSIVGDGAEKEALEKLCNELGCVDRVKFYGRIPRDQVMEILKDTHCFVMVSKGEIFGLVYLEAMAASCIAIGSLREGIDGIIVDKKNGYLCEPADVKALQDKLTELVNNTDLKAIACEGYKTAEAFADSKVAADYLETVIK